MEGSSPIYLQITDYLKRLIASGELADGDMLPSRRELSAYLGVNPNTVQKAYRLLEEEGLISSRLGAKSYISLTDERAEEIGRRILEGEIRAAVTSLKRTGLTLDEAVSMVERYWD